MRSMCPLLGLALMISLAAAQDVVPRPKLSKTHLSKEQIAIYRLVLEDYVKYSGEGALSLAGKTVLLDRSDAFWEERCVESIQLDPPSSKLFVHRLDPAVALSPRMVIFDPDELAKVIKDNNLRKDATNTADGDEKATKDRPSDAANRALRAGFFTLSEIAFDKHHRHAVLTYSFYCGGLCGNGAMVVLDKSGGKWKIGSKCGVWIS
jgi:hypothetical protein